MSDSRRWSRWGGLIETPNINKLAANGLTYTNWHTTALCSPTRSSLLTGRNHTTNGMACIAEATTGYPNANGHIPFECATIAEVLGERGWNTYMLGKWHLVAADEMNMASTKRNWPVGPRLRALLRFPRWRDEPVVSGPGLRQPPRRAAELAGGWLPPDDRPDRQGHRVHPRLEDARSRQALLHVLLPGRHPCSAPRPQGVDRQVQGQIRHGLREVPRDGLRAPAQARHLPGHGGALTDQPVCGRDERRREAMAAA